MDGACELVSAAPTSEAIGEPLAGPIAEKQGGLALRPILSRLARGLPVIVTGLILGTFVGLMVLRSLPAQYASTASMLIDPKRPGAFGPDAAFANLVVDSTKVASVELVLVSSELLDRVVQATHLDGDPIFGAASSSPVRRWLTRLAPDLFPPLADNADARRARAVYWLGRRTRTARVGMTYVITVTVTAPGAEQAQRLTGSVVEAYLSGQIDTKIDAAQRDTAWLTQQLAQLRADLVDRENAIENIRRRYGIVDTSATDGATLDHQAATDINTQLQQAEGQVAISRGRYEQARHMLDGSGSLDELPEVSDSQVIVGLRAQQAEAARRLARLGAIYTSQFPEMAHAEADMHTLNGEIAVETRRIVAGLRHTADTNVILRDTLRKRLSALVSAAGNTGQIDGRIQLRQAQRMLEASQLAYTAALARLRELALQPARQDAEMRVISAPELPDRPSFPKPILFLGGGGALGLGMGMGGVLLLPLMRRRVEDDPAAGRLLALPLLAAVPRLSRVELNRHHAASSYLAAKPVSAFADSLRLIRGALRTSQGMPQVVQLTSAVRGEGKSTLSASLAVSAAMAGQRTVIVDLDFFRPSVASLFNVTEGPGVGDVLAGFEYAALPQIWRADLPLRIIGAGARHRPLADALEGRNFQVLMATLREQFDFIVLDTPPILAVADAVLIARHADAIIMVCAWRTTPQDMAERAVLKLRLARGRLAGFVVNKVVPGGANTYPDSYYANWHRHVASPARLEAG